MGFELKRRLFSILAALMVSCIGLTTVMSAHAADQVADGGQLEVPYTDINVLSEAERAFLKNEISAHHLSDAPGSLAVIFPQNRQPLIGTEAEQAFLSGAVSIMSFSGLPNSFLGSMAVGKQIAEANSAPVLAIHSGYGDAGVTSEGPKVFFKERTMNRLGVAYTDPVLKSALALLKKRDLGLGTITLVGYCLGAIKAGNLTLHLEKERKDIFKTLRVLSVGLGVFHSKLLTADNKRQVMGNLDQFGRINATTVADTLLVPGASHTIRRDRPDGLPIPVLEEVFAQGVSWLPSTITPASVSDADLPQLIVHLQSEAKLIETMQAEVALVSSGNLTDEMHDEKLAHKHALLSVQAHALELETLKRQGVSSADSRFKALQSALSQEQKAVDSHKAAFDRLVMLRSATSDLEEYQEWTSKKK